MQTTYTPGTKGTTSGFPAVVIRMYSAGMVEVRVPGGVTCIPVGDFKVAA